MTERNPNEQKPTKVFESPVGQNHQDRAQLQQQLLELPRAGQGAGMGAQGSVTASGLGHFQTPPASQMGMGVTGKVRDMQEFPLEFHKSHGDSGPEHSCVKSMHLP